MLKKFPIWLVIGLISFVLIQAGATGFNSEQNQMVSLYLNSFKKTFGSLSASQANYISQIVVSFLDHGDRDWRKLSYILATAWHETGGFKYLIEQRAKPGTDLYNIQNKYWPSGFYGRGLVQLTHETNYKKMGDILGIDLVNNPDLAADPRYAADILVIGMMKGIFTGKALNNYINVIADYFNARRVVNGTDKAQLIADYATSINKNFDFQIIV